MLRFRGQEPHSWSGVSWTTWSCALPSFARAVVKFSRLSTTRVLLSMLYIASSGVSFTYVPNGPLSIRRLVTGEDVLSNTGFLWSWLVSAISYSDTRSMNSLSSLWTFLFDAIAGRMSSVRSLCFLIPCKDSNGKADQSMSSTCDDQVLKAMTIKSQIRIPIFRILNWILLWIVRYVANKNVILSIKKQVT